MHILISNDDGYQAKGLICLANILSRTGKVTVVAPDRDRSGASNSLTLEHPIRATTQENGYVCVDGTPTDCVHLAITGLLEHEPDMVVSGINHGANMGDDVLYSGTVAAAMEGRFLGFPAIAVSLAHRGNPQHFETAAQIVLDLVNRLRADAIPSDTILNINVPDLPHSKIGRLEVTRLGHRHKSEPVIKSKDPRGRPFYWVGPPGAEQDAGPGTDFYAVKSGNVSVTPIHTDLTQHSIISEIRQWLGVAT